MSNFHKIKSVSFSDFLLILKYAQKRHQQNDEPIPDIGINGVGKVESSLATPFQKLYGKTCYRGFYSKATMLFYLLTKNHCLQNGNKRMAILTLSFFSFKNYRSFLIKDEEIYWLAKRTAMSSNQRKCLHRIRKILAIKLKRKEPIFKSFEKKRAIRDTKRNKLKSWLIDSKIKSMHVHYEKNALSNK